MVLKECCGVGNFRVMALSLPVVHDEFSSVFEVEGQFLITGHLAYSKVHTVIAGTSNVVEQHLSRQLQQPFATTSQSDKISFRLKTKSI